MIHWTSRKVLSYYTTQKTQYLVASGMFWFKESKMGPKNVANFKNMAKNGQKGPFFGPFFSQNGQKNHRNFKNAQICAYRRDSYGVRAAKEHSLSWNAPRSPAVKRFYDFEIGKIHKGPPLVILLKNELLSIIWKDIFRKFDILPRKSTKNDEEMLIRG